MHDCMLQSPDNTFPIRLSGLEPFPSPKNGDAGTYSNVVLCEYEFIKPFFNKISKNAQDFISKIVTLNPSDRMTVQQALDHPWAMVGEGGVG